MRQRITFAAISVTLLLLWSPGCQPGKEKGEVNGLEGTWVEVHALAEYKPNGRGGYYAWKFEGEKVIRAHTQTIDGEPLIGSSHAGTYKLDTAATPKAIDIVLKSPGGEDWKYQGIYKLEGDIFKLCLDKDKRPAAFDSKDGSRLYVLKRPPRE